MSPNALPSTDRPIRSAFTIASGSELPSVRALAGSYLFHHPGHRFLVVMIDGTTTAEDAGRERFELVPLAEIPVPNPGAFHYQYTPPQLKAAILPFCMKALLDRHAADAMLYIDTDMMVFRPLNEAWDALADHDLVLVPHMRGPFPDHEWPTESTILQGGVYNPGFIGLRRSEAAATLLRWWAERPYPDEAIQPPPALAGQQKCLDLVPAYTERVKILRHPAYAVGYRNLHERDVVQAGSGFLVDGQPLATFQFSGYDPQQPDVLSRDQSRHWLAELPAVRAICKLYETALGARGGAEGAPTRHPTMHLDNGVEVSRAMNLVVLHCVRARIAFPAPGVDADGFCRFLATPNPAIFGADVAPLVTALLTLRPDVAAAFPGAWSNKHDPGFNAWLEATGAAEEHLVALLDLHGGSLAAEDPFTSVLALYDRRSDLRHAFPDVFSSTRQYREFEQWLATFGRSEEGVDAAMLAAFRRAEGGFSRTVNAYFGRLDLLRAHPLLYQDDAVEDLAAAISRSLGQFAGLEWADVQAFKRVAKARKEDLLLASLRYNPYVREQIGGLPSAFNIDRIGSYLEGHGAGERVASVVARLLSTRWISPCVQLRAFWTGSPSIRHLFPAAGHSPADASECAHYLLGLHRTNASLPGWEEWGQRLLETCRQPLRQGVNLVGYLDTPTGMGESARSMLRQLDGLGIECSTTVLASCFQEDSGTSIDGDLQAVYGGHDAGLRINIIVANAPDFPRVRDWLPRDIWPGRRNIGYWVWETETLPARFAGAAQDLDAIWTPSEYSADAIRNSVEIPVHVLPHALDFAALDNARPARGAFGLPQEALLYGYFFDSKSELERKNPAGVIDAFRLAFGSRRDVVLVLKVASPLPGQYEYEQLRGRAGDLNVIWLEQTLDRRQSLDLMASLDVYVSLHRAEGFGLTMAEAMAMGKPVVATGYSGNLEFMDGDCALLVDHEVITTIRPHGPYPAGSRWSAPSVAHAAHLMSALECRERRDALHAKARSHVRGMLGPERLGPRLSSLVAELHRAVP